MFDGNETGDPAQKDFEFIHQIIPKEAKINDVYGATRRTLLHIVAAEGLHVNVAKFLIKRGAEVIADTNGETSLHVAAARNDLKLIDTLLCCRNSCSQVNVTAKTKAGQTPLHYAARSDAVEACEALAKWMTEPPIDPSKSIDVGDRRDRTPLFAAVEFGKCNSAKWLVKHGANLIKEDKSGRSCLTLMVKKMSRVAMLALNRFHEVDKPNRKERFRLGELGDLLLPANVIKSDGDVKRHKTRLLEYIADYGELDVIMHPIILKILEVKWLSYGRKMALKQLAKYLLYITIWTVLGIGVSWQSRYKYDLPTPDIWRILFWILAMFGTAYFIYIEITEYRTSHKKFKTLKEKGQRNIEKDEKCYRQITDTDPNATSTDSPYADHLEQEESDLSRMKSPYFRDFWNIFDCAIYFTTFAVLVLHIIEIAGYTADNRPPPCCGEAGCNATAELIRHGDLNDLSACSSLDAKVNEGSLSVWLNRIIAIKVMMMWLGLIKHLRAFRHLGPLIVMLGKILGDVGWFLLLFSIFYLAYVFAFWIIFGLHTPVNTMSSVDQIVFSLYRITLVDEYQYEKMHAFDIVMTYLLVGTFLVISAVLCINILIALISETFHRIYKNAKATAMMQKAAFIVKIEQDLSDAARDDFKKVIAKKYNPQEVAISDTQDDAYDDEADISQMRSVIDENQDEIKKVLQKIESMEAKLDKSLSKLSDASSQARSIRKNIKDVMERSSAYRSAESFEDPRSTTTVIGPPHPHQPQDQSDEFRDHAPNVSSQDIVTTQNERQN